MRRDLDSNVELLVRCADPTNESEADVGIGSLLRADPDWDRVVELAGMHGVTPLVDRTLGTWFRDRVPEPVLSRLAERTRRIAMENVRLATALHDLDDWFGTAGIRWLPFKGPVLAQAAYGDLALRTFMDLDVLVHPADLSRAIDLLEARGFERKYDVRRLDDSIVLGGPFTQPLVPEYTLFRDDVEVEVRCTVGDPDRPFDVPFEDLHSRRTTVEVAGREVPALSPVDRLLVLAYHGTKHNWHLLKWTCDFAAAATSPSLDWERVHRRTRQTGTERKLLLAVSLVGMLFDAEVSRNALPSDEGATALATQVVERMADGGVTRPVKSQRTWFNARATDSTRDALATILSYRKVRPGFREYGIAPLPGPLHPLYYVTAPVRAASGVLGWVKWKLRN